MLFIRAARWRESREGHVRLIDQTLLPTELRYIDCKDTETLWEAIKVLRVRGAPALGVAGAMGVVLGLRGTKAASGDELVKEAVEVFSNMRTIRSL